jgi:hypothetical protein
VHKHRGGKIFQILRGEDIGRLVIKHTENTVLVDLAQAYSRQPTGVNVVPP